MESARDLDALLRLVEESLGPPPWVSPDGYPDSTALCILDSIWSIGVRYSGVVNVVNAYRRLRVENGADPETDSAADLLAAISAAGGSSAFADAVHNHQLTSPRGGILKAEAVMRAAEVLQNLGAGTMQSFRALDADRLELLASRWSKVKGQGSGLSFTYFLMLTGVADVKADRMVCGFVSAALGREAKPEEARRLVTELHVRDFPEQSLLSLDHAIWKFQSGG